MRFDQEEGTLMAGKGSKSKKQLTLTQALAQFLAKTLLPDLKERAKHPAVNAALMRQWQAEKAAQRTADGLPAWGMRTLEQVGAAWVLSCVFVRTLEDRELLGRRRIAGPGAADSEQLFFELAPSLTARDYLLTVFREVASLPGAEDLLGPAHNPAWRLSPSNEAARALLDFFRQQEGQGASDVQDALVWRFDGDDTRFLGDLYQDISEDVRKRYALLQTPDFVERFILEQTLEPAIAEFGLENVRVIDPTCGSGHFLLGAFDRLLSHRQRAAPAVDVRDHALAALGQVYGVDVNPYAVAIARFRLTLVYLQRTGITKLAQAPRLPLNLVVADSLLHGAKNTNVLFAEHESAAGDYKAWGADMFALDDPQAARVVFRQRYHAVVGNPPYITCKDSALREAYRERYQSAAGKYALAAPFTERFFELATDGGFVGLINANSFMKREFGKTLIEKVLPQFELTSVIDTSGAYVPGHGTPTVLLFGRNRKSAIAMIHAVLGKRGEPSTPEDAEHGLVWRSIADHLKEVGFENDYISVADVPCSTFKEHPWSLGGGGAADLKASLEDRAERTLGDIATAIGFDAIMGEDELFHGLPSWLARLGIANAHQKHLVTGDVIRDWSIAATDMVIFPYGKTLVPELPDEALLVRNHFWRYRAALRERRQFGKSTIEAGLQWFEYRSFYKSKRSTPLSITFAEVATHNHFVLDRGGKVFKQTAPIIKLPESATEDDHLALLAYLNSSIACFWMKQVSYPKSSASGDISVEKGKPEANRYAFAGTALAKLPLPDLSGETGRWMGVAARCLLELAQERGSLNGEALVATVAAGGPGDVGEVLARRQAVQRKMATLQEDIDWAVYRLFDMADGFEVTEGSFGPEERPFLREEDDVVSVWRSRKKAAAASSEIAFVEQIVYKRPWWGRQGVFGHGTKTFEDEVSDACVAWVQARAEKLIAARGETTKTVAAAMAKSSEAGRVLSLYAQKGDATEVIAEILADADSVPVCAALVFSETGLTKQSQWRKTWALQRREDLGEAVGQVPVPQKYDQKDYRDANFWRLRGKLDVPKERFISYPGCEKDGDPSPLIGWAGWNHLQRAQALVALYQERKNDDGWPRDRLMPMLVGLHELMFWLELWHSQPEPGSQNPAREFKQFLDAELHTHALTTDDLEAWRPPARKSSAKRAAAKPVVGEVDAHVDVVAVDDDATTKPKRPRRRKADLPVETP